MTPPAGSGLEQRVQALEKLVQQLGSSEALVPNYLTVDQAGRVGASFAGHVHAQGLDLDAGASSTPPDQDRVRWIRQSDGAVVAQEFGYTNPGSATLELGGRPAVATDRAYSRLNAYASDGTSVGAQIYASYQQSPASAAVVAGAIGSVRVIIDNTGASDYLQVGSTQAAAANWGVSSFVGNGTNSSGGLNVAHGLVRTPGFAIATIIGIGAYSEQSAAADATNIHPAFITPSGTFANGTTYFFYWLAIG